METNELRVGNWVLHHEFSSRSSSTQPFQVGIQDLAYSSLINPIPITEEWLVKFGFENLDFPNEFDLNAFCVRRSSKDGIFHYITNDRNVRPIIKHVHQLQNLYFALTGEEITIKQ